MNGVEVDDDAAAAYLFDDLSPRPSDRALSARQPTATPTKARVVAHRCGHCRTPGYYRKTCPELATSP